MADVNTSYNNASSFGTPAFEVLDTYKQQNLIAGVEPRRQQPVRILLASSLTLAKFSVVGLNASNQLTLATWASDGSGVKPIGVLEYAATSDASNTTKFGEVVLTGCYNTDADSPLVWDSTFDTQAKKNGSVVGNPNLIFRSRNVA